MRIKTQDERVFEGTALQIVQQMKSLSMHSEVSIRDYVAETVVRAAINDDVYICPEGAEDEELSASLVDKLVEAGLAERL